LLKQGWTYEDVAEVLGNSAAIVKKHYAKWSRGTAGPFNEYDAVGFPNTKLVHTRKAADERCELNLEASGYQCMRLRPARAFPVTPIIPIPVGQSGPPIRE
jgi:hypothetical protein